MTLILVEASHEPENGLVDFQRLAQLRFMAHEQVRKEQGTFHEPGRDGFHSVPDVSDNHGDAVERVPTRFMAPMRVQSLEVEASHEPENGSLISNDLRSLGSWPVSRSVRNKGLSMNHKIGRAVLCAPTPATTLSFCARYGAHIDGLAKHADAI